MYAAIWAQDLNGIIGKDGTLPWHLPNDLKFFKEKTLNHTLVMGRKTFEGMGARPLPNRETIVLTTDETYQATGVKVMHSVNEVRKYAKNLTHPILIVGGTGVFNSLLAECDLLYRTIIEAEFIGDTVFPEVDWTQWELIESQAGVVDEKNKYPHRFETYKRRMCVLGGANDKKDI